MAELRTNQSSLNGDVKKTLPEDGNFDLSGEEKGGLDEGGQQDPKDQTDDYPEGGTRAWLVAAGTGGVFFSTLGMVNSIGVFQAYYMSHQLRHESADKVAWIGSIQMFLLFAAGMVGGPLFDRFGAKVIRPSAVVYIFGIMMTSLCKEYWQFMLAQGVLTGLANGLVMAPAMPATAQYFHKRRGAAMGLAVCGSSIGAVVFPIILSKMLNETNLGFGWSVRIVGFIICPVLLASSFAIKARLPPRKTQFLLPSAFRSRLYVGLIAANFFLMLGMTTPVFFLPTFAESQGVNPTLASYLIAMLNGGSIFGRIIPGILADKLGRLNMLFAMGLATGIIVLCWTTVQGVAGNVVYAVAFGFASGAIASGGMVAMSLCPEDPRDLGTYMGQGQGISSFAVLIGPPITGALLDKYGGYLELSIFSGVLALFGALMVLVGKFYTKEGVLGKV